MDFFKTINVIFTEQVRPPGFYNLRLDESEICNDNININDVLINVFINGIHTLFGESVTPANIKKEQFLQANRYMLSLGYDTQYEYIIENNIPINVKIWFNKYEDNSF